MWSRLTVGVTEAFLVHCVIVAPTQAQLDPVAYAQSFTISGADPNQLLLPGSALNLHLVTDELPDLNRVEAVLGDVDLALVFKHLQVTSITDNTPLGPFPPSAPGQDPSTRPVEAWAGTFTGKIPIGFREIHEVLTFDVRWHFLDEANNPIPQADVFSTQPGESPTDLKVVFAPKIRKWTVRGTRTLAQALEGATHSKVKIYAELRVRSSEGTNSGWHIIPPDPADPTKPLPIEVQVADLPLPDIMVAFRQTRFRENALVLLPSSSPFGEQTCFKTLCFTNVDLSEILSLTGTLAGAVDGLKVFAKFTPLGNVLDVLIDKLPNAGVTISLREKQKDMDKTVMVNKNNAFDEDWEDRISSILGIAPSIKLQLFEHDDNEGPRLSLRPSWVDDNVTILVKSLKSTSPSAEPPGALIQTGTPDDGWDNKISSWDWDN